MNMSYQDPNQQSQYPNQGQYGGYTGYTPPTDPYSGQAGQTGYGSQPGYGQQQQYGQPQYGQQQQYGQPQYGQPQYGTPSPAGTSTGLSQNVAAGLSYILGIIPLIGWIPGLIFFLLEKQNRFVRFHAMQAILFFGGIAILSIIIGLLPFGLSHLNFLVGLISFVGWIVLMIMGFQGKYFKLPIIGDYAEKFANQ
jgi:uncharacterized membrane protein